MKGRNERELFSSNRGISDFYAARHIDDLSGGSALEYEIFTNNYLVFRMTWQKNHAISKMNHAESILPNRVSKLLAATDHQPRPNMAFFVYYEYRYLRTHHAIPHSSFDTECRLCEAQQK